MGTRALTFVYDDDVPMACIYSQWDGYPSDLGKDLATVINSRTLVNGLVGDTTTTANGMGCLAALIISKLKGNEAGGFYLYPVTTMDAGQEYEYHIFDKKVIVKDKLQKKLFEGDWQSFLEYCINYD